MLPQVSLDLGVCFQILTDYVKTNQYFLKSKVYFEKNGDTVSVAMALSNLAYIERELKKIYVCYGILHASFSNHL